MAQRYNSLSHFFVLIILYFIVIDEVILLDANADVRTIEQEERIRFLYNVITAMDLPVDEFWQGELKLNTHQRMYLREILLSYNVQVIEDLDGHMQIYVEEDLIAEWLPCRYVLKKDLRQKDPKKRFYLEMGVNAWTIFDDDNDE